MRLRLFAGFLLAGAVTGTAAASEPRVPNNDGEILQRLPAGNASRALAPLRAKLSTNPADPAANLALASAYLEIGRAQADPRYVSYALTTVAPLVSNDDHPEALILAANAQQYLHRFDVALQLLGRVLTRDPANAQALLIRADLLEVQGELPAARLSCTRLLLATDPLVALTCISSVSSRTGDLDASFQRLRHAYETSPRLPAEVDVWILGVLAEMAQRRQDEASRTSFLQLAMQRAPQDLKVRAQYADLLLERADYAAAQKLLLDNQDQDALLLRLAIAATRERGHADPLAMRWSSSFEQRMQQSSGDARHQREQARFLLEVRHDATGALRAATDNWQRQREPEDIRLLLSAAAAAGQPQSADSARHWVAANHYEDRSLP